MTTYSGTKEFVGATFVKASFKGATLRFSDVSGVTMRSGGRSRRGCGVGPTSQLAREVAQRSREAGDLEALRASPLPA